MPQENVPMVAFNRGIISRLALARIDIERSRLSAETQTNWMPRVLGSMMLRPGLGYIGSTYTDLFSVHVPFVFATEDTALVEFTNTKMRVRIGNDIVTRESVSTSVSDDDFSTDGGDWVDADETGATSTINTTDERLELTGTNFAQAIRRQEVTVSVSDQNTEHSICVKVDRGPVTIRVGSSSGDDDYVTETNLGAGTHSLAFTPTGNFWIEFANVAQSVKYVDSCTIETAGDMIIDSPYAEADLRKIRWTQSADVIYLSCAGYQQYKVERRATKSWSLVKYEVEDGPFRVINVSTVSLTASALNGDITLTSSRNYFKAGHVDALFRLTSIGQKIEATLTGENQFSDPIRITGVGSSQRSFSIVRSGTWSATLTLQRSVGEPGAWIDVNTYATNGTSNYNDGLDNQIIFYRLGIKSGDYTSGTADIELTYSNGGLTGIVKVTGFTSNTEVDATVLSPLGGTDATTDWSEGEWSPLRGYPSSVALFEGRLWWAGKGKIYGSVSDAYESFDDETEGDSGPINRSIGSGPVDNIQWLLGLNRLIFGTEGSEWSVRSSSLDDPLSPSNFNLREPSTQGSANVPGVKLDSRGLFTQRSGTRIYQLNYDDDLTYDYESADLTELAPEVTEPSIVRMAVQRQPDTRVHCVRSDGKVAVLIDEPAEEVLCWVIVETDGEVEDAIVLPGTPEDEVYYVVKRTINGGTKRYLEKWAIEADARGATMSKLADSFITYSGAATTTITGLSHLEGEEVVIWADGKDVGTKTVSSGQITLDTAASEVCAGLVYTAQFKSTKLAYAAGGGTALSQLRKADHIGLILADTHYQGIKYGPNFTDLDDLPLVNEQYEDIAEDTVFEAVETEQFEFDQEWGPDPRLCLQAQAPRPATVLGVIPRVQTSG